MVPKENLLLLGLFATVVLISSEVRARDLDKASSISAMARIVKEQKDTSDVEYEKSTCIEDRDHLDCFFGFPCMPGGGDMPGMPGGGDKPGTPGGGDKPGDMPGMPGGGDMPGAPGSGTDGPSAQP